MKRPDSASVTIIICFIIVAILSVSLVFMLGEQSTAKELDVSLLQELADTIRSNYFFFEDLGLDNDQLLEAAMRGMISRLDDPYAQYFTEEEYQKLLSDNEGNYIGIGISIQTPDEIGAKVVNVYTGSPADLAGIRKGDVITRINGISTAGKGLEEVLSFFSDDVTMPEELTYLRGGVETTVSLTRAEVHIDRVTYEALTEDIGYVRILEFNGSVAEEFANAVDALQELGAKNLIIDLRDNPGGGLYEVLNVAYRMIPKGELIVSIRSKNGDESVYTSKGEETISMRLAVLVNGYSASASELLAAALQDYQLATVVGTQTFGKGIVQSYFHLSGNRGWAKMTTDAYYTPNGVCIHDVGVTPDLIVELPEELNDLAIELLEPAQDTQLQAAIALFSQQSR